MTLHDHSAVSRRKFLRLGSAAALLPLLPACGGPEIVAAEGVPKSRFNEYSTAEEVTEGIDLNGKIAVVTGCTSGIGFETMRVLAKRGCYVVGTGRTLEKAQAACVQVDGITTPVQLELSDFDSVVDCAESIRSLNSPIDMVICNAGMRGGGRTVAYGLEKHFVANHLGHFILVNRLLDRLYFSWQGRVVVVGSRAAYRDAPEEGIEFGNLRATHDYSTKRAYAHSKLANILFSLELARQLRGSRITSNSLHPGLVDTNIIRHESSLTRGAFRMWTRLSGKSVEEGAATTCYVATSPSLGAVSGEYFEDCNAVNVLGDNHIHDTEMAAQLWQVSAMLTKDYLVDYSNTDWTEFEYGPRKRSDA